MKTVLITGASSGIGKEFAYTYAKRGYQLILTARSEDVLKQLTDELRNTYGISCFYFTQDLSEQNAARTLVNKIAEKNLQVDVLINDAGFATKGLLETYDFEKQNREIQVNVHALTELTYLLISKMAERGEGQVINIASAAGLNPIPFNAVYAATKAYVLSFSQSVDFEYRPHGVRVLAVCPQATDTHFFDEFNKMQGKMRRAEDVVNTTMKALDKGKRVCYDGYLCKLQNAMSHIFPRQWCVRITGRVGKKTWG